VHTPELYEQRRNLALARRKTKAAERGFAHFASIATLSRNVGGDGGVSNQLKVML
jgi:hypothetical protein